MPSGLCVLVLGSFSCYVFSFCQSSMHTCTGHGSSTCLLHKLAFGVRLGKYQNATHLKLNIAPEKLPSHKENSLLTIHFQGPYGTSTNKTILHHFTRCLFFATQSTTRRPKSTFTPTPPGMTSAYHVPPCPYICVKIDTTKNLNESEIKK